MCLSDIPIAAALIVASSVILLIAKIAVGRRDQAQMLGRARCVQDQRPLQQTSLKHNEEEEEEEEAEVERSKMLLPNRQVSTAYTVLSPCPSLPYIDCCDPYSSSNSTLSSETLTRWEVVGI